MDGILFLGEGGRGGIKAKSGRTVFLDMVRFNVTALLGPPGWNLGLRVAVARVPSLFRLVARGHVRVLGLLLGLDDFDEFLEDVLHGGFLENRDGFGEEGLNLVGVMRVDDELSRYVDTVAAPIAVEFRVTVGLGGASGLFVAAGSVARFCGDRTIRARRPVQVENSRGKTPSVGTTVLSLLGGKAVHGRPFGRSGVDICRG